LEEQDVHNVCDGPTLNEFPSRSLIGGTINCSLTTSQ